MQIGRIDFSMEDRKKALTILQALQEEGAVNELGIGVITDALANYFSLGASTPHTRFGIIYSSLAIEDESDLSVKELA